MPASVCPQIDHVSGLWNFPNYRSLACVPRSENHTVIGGIACDLLTPSSTVVQKNFHPTYIFGLVKAKPIDVRAECANGVAFASTRMTVPNWLVGLVTIGIVTPHEVKVTCAAGGSAMLQGGAGSSETLTIHFESALTGATR